MQKVKFDTRKVDWVKFNTTLQNLVTSNRVLNDQILTKPPSLAATLKYLKTGPGVVTGIQDQVTQAFTDSIIEAAKSSIPVVQQRARGKPWWTQELKDLRTMMAEAKRLLMRQIDNQELRHSYREARNTYFSAIKKAKHEHWVTFLEKEDTTSIFKAMSYTREFQVRKIPDIKVADGQTLEKTFRLGKTFQGKCRALRATLYPTPPHAPEQDWTDYQSRGWTWPELTKDELERACSANIKGKTPGPDTITQEIITHAYHAIPLYFMRIYACLFDSGYHPLCWK